MFPDLTLELVTTDYLGGALEPRLAAPQVKTALREMTAPTNASRWSLQPFDVYYGMKVRRRTGCAVRCVPAQVCSYCANLKRQCVSQRM